MQHIPKQSHYVRCPSLELLCNSLCGPLARSLETLSTAVQRARQRILQLRWIASWQNKAVLTV